MTHLQEVAVRLSIAEALNGRWFNVCGIAKACEVLGIKRDHSAPDWVVLHALHTHKWELLDRQAKVELVQTVGRVLGLEPTCNVLSTTPLLLEA